MNLTPPQLALRTLRTTHALFVLSIVFYAFVGEKMMQHAATPASATMIVGMAVAAAGIAAAAAIIRGKFVAPSVEALRLRPENGKALKSWQAGSLISLALAESVGLCGVALRAGGVPLEQALPFYLAAIVLMMIWRPRLDLSSASGPD
jgi:hypothetical protein